MSEIAPDFVPASWNYPVWPGVCECGCDSVFILCVTEQSRIVQYDLWVQCSMCWMSYQLEAPKEGDDD